MGLYAGIAAVVVLAIAGFMWKSSEDAKAEKIAAEKAVAAEKQRVEAAREKAEAEAKAKAEAEAARLKREADAAAKLKEEEARQQRRQELEAERIAKSPGKLTVATAPNTASITIDGGPAQKSPLSLDDLTPGAHRVHITLAGHESVDRSFEIKGTETTDLGVIRLEPIYGTVAISSQPDGVDFSFRPAISLLGVAPKTGRTPATLDEVEPGEYVVTFSRAPWKDQTQNISVAKRGAAKASVAFPIPCFASPASPRAPP